MLLFSWIENKNNKRIIKAGLIFLSLMVSQGILYFLLGRSFIQSIYHGRINVFIKSLYANLERHPLEHYLIYSDLMAFVVIPYCLFMSFLLFLFLEQRVSTRFFFLIFLLSGIILRCFVAAGDVLALQSWPLCDDSYYYFNIARNIVSGNGVRHDSFHSTTGFQPLFLISLIPVYAITGNKNTAIHLVLFLQTAFGAIFGLLLYKTSRLLTSKKAALFSLMVWAYSVYCLSLDLNGLETGLALCLLIGILYYYLRHFVFSKEPTTQNYLTLGILTGLGFLARTDQALLLPALVLDIILRPNGQRVSKRVTPLALFLGAWAFMALPWLVYNLIMEKSFLPSSGAAVRFLSLSYGFTFMKEMPHSLTYFKKEAIPWLYYLGSLKSGLVALLRVLDSTFSLAIGLIVLGAGLIRRTRPEIKPLRPIGLFSVFLFLAYTLYIFGQWFYHRYFAPLLIPYVLIITMLSYMIWKTPILQNRNTLKKYGLIVLFFFIAGWMVSTSVTKIAGLHLRTKPTGYYEAAHWINHHTPPGSRIGAFQTGIMGYYLERPFFGLDGKINRAALRAMEADQMDRYINNNKIQFLTDWPWILEALLTNHAKDREFLNHYPVVYEESYRIVDLR